MLRRHLIIGAAGVVGSTTAYFLTNTTPSAPPTVASQHSIDGAASPPRLRRGIIAFSKVVAQEPRRGVLSGCGFAALCLFVANSGSRGFVPEPAPQACTPCSPPGPFDIRPWRAASPVWLRTPGRDSCGDN